MKPIGLLKRGGRVPKNFFSEKPNETKNTLVKLFFVLGNAEFFKFKNASELS